MLYGYLHSPNGPTIVHLVEFRRFFFVAIHVEVVFLGLWVQKRSYERNFLSHILFRAANIFFF